MTSATSSDADSTSAGHGLLVHEWIEQIGGSENVLDEFARIFPGTDIFSLWNNAPERYAGHRVLQSRLAHTPIRRNSSRALASTPTDSSPGS